MTKPPDHIELRLGHLGAVGRAASLALAIVLARMLATALSLTVILSFTGVLRQRGSVLRGQQHASSRQLCDGGTVRL